MPKIAITIKLDGLLHIDAQEFIGQECKSATKFLDKMSNLIEEKKKPEFYQEKTNTQIHKI